MAHKVGWGVHLIGHSFDLADWADALQVPFDPWVDQKDDEYFLRTGQFDALANADEVRGRAVAIVEQLNAAMEIKFGSRPVRFEGVVEYRADGTRGIHMSVAVGSVEARRRAGAIGIAIAEQEGSAPLPKESHVQQWVAISEDHDLLADALIYFNRAEWFDVYKAIECLEDWVGGEDALRAKGWVAASDIKRVKRTANSYRHRQGGKHTPPLDPISLADARRLLGNLIAKAFGTAKGEA
ncbi:hypothetical protein [Bradyrhizobium sp. CCBAU 53415]|uniref:hypothetical protein n=1 Tax=Bradyrhizobium sp. CCBAU 53415 TaxID=1325119 RepID=UPI0023054A38|nr:hypothetical protein [Bradyrhizobium sp. CCBAU 53415]